MRIKGAFPVRWAAQDGKNGTGVTVASTQIKYAANNSGTTHPTSGWQNDVPSNSQGKWVWTWTHLVFSDSTYLDIYSVSYVGVDGRGIQSSEVTYSLKQNPVDPTTITDWGNFPSTLTDGYWLYTRTHIVYSSGTPTDSYSVAQVGVGSYYAGCSEYYAVLNSPTTIPSGSEPPTAGTYAAGNNPSINTGVWKTNRNNLSYDVANGYIYLWNFEISRDSRGNQYVTDAICIGNFARGIQSIVETYAKSSMGVPESGRDYPSDITNQDWVDEHQDAAPTEAKPYQWNRTAITYNDNVTEYHYHVSAVKGADGKGSTYIDIDNENDSILYDGNGSRVSSVVTSQGRLYSNGQLKTTGITWKIDPSQSSGVTVKNNGNSTSSTYNGATDAWINGSGLVTVNGISADTAYIMVMAYYNNVYYYAKMTIKKLAGVDKFELVISPSAITYNSTTASYSSNEVTVKVYRTAQNGTRTLVQSLSTFGLTLRYYYGANGPTTITNYSSGVTRTIYPANYDTYRYELLDSNSNVIDYETIPICRFKNGDNAFILDVDNEMIGVAVTKDGVSEYSQSWEITAKAFYGSSVASNVTYALTTTGNNGLNHTPPLTIGTYDTSTNKFTISTALGWWGRDTVVQVKITATHSTYGTREAYVILHPIFAGQNGEPATVYELKPSLTSISFTRTSANGLTPSQILINCGYTKNVGGTLTTYVGTDRNNLWTEGGAPYNIMYRPVKSDGTYGGWGWMKDLESANNYALPVASSTSYVAYEFILTSASGTASVAETNIIDRETIPITKDGNHGFNPKTIYANSFDKPSTPTGSTPWTAANSIWSENPVEQAAVSVQQQGDWYKGADGYMVAPAIAYNQNTVQVIQFLTTEANQEFKIRIKSNTKSSYGYVYVGNLDAGHSTSSYKQRITGLNKVTEVSFTVGTAGFHTITIGYVKSNNTVATFDGEYVKFTCGKMSTWQSTSASFNSDGTVATWSSPIEMVVGESDDTVVQTHANILYQTAFQSAYMDKWNPCNGVTATGLEGRNAFKGNNSGNNAVQPILQQVIYDPNGEMRLEGNKWYTLSFYAKAASNGVNWLYTYIYPNMGSSTQANTTAIDVNAGRIIDGVQSNSAPTDCNKLWNLTTQWVRHTITFKTRAIPSAVQYILFRLVADAGDVYICMPKLEEGTHATDYCINENDTLELAAEETGFPNDRGQWVQDYGNDPYMWSNTRRDYVASNVSGDWKRYFVKRKGMTVPNGTAPTAGGNQYWEEGHRISVLLVNTIVGANAELTFAKTNRILVTNANGTVAAGLGGAENGNTDYPLWIGATYANRASAAFRVTLLGKLYATGAEISGKITATEGTIGGFTIGSSSITSDGASILRIGTDDFKTQFGITSTTKSVSMNGNPNGITIRSYNFTYRENNRFTLRKQSSSSSEWLNFGAANIIDLDFFNRATTTTPTNRYGFQYAMIGKGHVIVDGIVEGACYDIVTFSAANQVHMIQFPLYGNRINVKSSYDNDILILPDKYSVCSALGCGFIRNDISQPFTFRIDIINTGTKNIYVAGYNDLKMTDNSQPFLDYNLPYLRYRNTSYLDEKDVYVRPQNILSIMLMYDSSGVYRAMIINQPN